MKAKKEVCYTYLKKTNKNFLEKLSKKSGQSLSHCLDEIMDSVRLNRELDIKPFVPKYVEKAKAYNARRSS